MVLMTGLSALAADGQTQGLLKVCLAANVASLQHYR